MFARILTFHRGPLFPLGVKTVTFTTQRTDWGISFRRRKIVKGGVLTREPVGSHRLGSHLGVYPVLGHVVEMVEEGGVGPSGEGADAMAGRGGVHRVAERLNQLVSDRQGVRIDLKVEYNIV